VITDFRVYNANFVYFNDYVTLDDLTYPCQKLTWEYPIVGDSQPRPFTAGRHDSRKNVGVMTLDVEGEIFTNTTTNYWIARKALARLVLPPAVQTPSIYSHSILRMQIDGDTTWYRADVQLTSYSIPLAATGAPTVSPFMFSWECNFGYWMNESTGQAVYL